MLIALKFRVFVLFLKSVMSQTSLKRIFFNLWKKLFSNSKFQKSFVLMAPSSILSHLLWLRQGGTFQGKRQSSLRGNGRRWRERAFPEQQTAWLFSSSSILMRNETSGESELHLSSSSSVLYRPAAATTFFWNLNNISKEDWSQNIIVKFYFFSENDE